MTAREFFADLRWAMTRLKEVELLLSSDGDGHRSPRRGSTVIPDPTSSRALRHLSSMEELLAERDAILQQREEGLRVISGISATMGDLSGGVLTLYYVEARTWGETSDELHISERQCMRIRDACMEWVDSVGFAHAKDGSGIAGI